MSDNTNSGAPAPESALSAPSISLDDAANLAIWEPEEDEQANPESGENQQSDAEPDAADEGQESAEAAPAEEDDTAEAGEEAAAEAAKPEPKDDVTVTVNGEKVPLSDLKAGYLRQADYSRKTQEVANSRRALEDMTGRVTKTVDAIASFLAKQIPDAPDPSLAMTSPGEYVQKKALHDAAVQQINTVLAQAGNVKAVAEEMTQQQRSDLIAAENAKLSERFPATVTQEGRKAFFDKAASAARDLGYSAEEIAAATDHRLFALAHYAQLGLAAEKAKTVAKAKVEGKPPVAPPKRQKGSEGERTRRNQEAMKRLARTGSIEDALLVDWD